MSTSTDLFSQLSMPFPASDIEWRIQRSGIKGDGNPWAIAIPYVTNRAIQNRLDSVFGLTGWRNEYREIDGGFLCGISIWCEDREEWLTKWDGADKTKVESIKGGISGAMKRAAVQLGIGRYLYSLDATFAQCFLNNQGRNRAFIKGQNGRDVSYSWNPPQLPSWALPQAQHTPAPVQNYGQPQNAPVADGNAPEPIPVTSHPERAPRTEQQKQSDREFARRADDYRKREREDQRNREWQRQQQQQQKSETTSIPGNYFERPERSRSNVVLTGKRVTPNQLNKITNGLAMANRHAADLCSHLRIDTLGKMDQGYYPLVMDWLRKKSQEPARPERDTGHSPRIQRSGCTMSTEQSSELNRMLKELGMPIDTIARNHDTPSTHATDNAYFLPWREYLSHKLGSTGQAA